MVFDFYGDVFGAADSVVMRIEWRGRYDNGLQGGKSNAESPGRMAGKADILKVESRNSDLIEHIHDGSWFDRTFGLSSGIFKLIYTSLCGIGLIVFTVSGFWLWYGPKLIRRHHEE